MSELNKEWDLGRYFYKSINDENIKKDLAIYRDKADLFIEKYKNKISHLDDCDFLIFLEELDVIDIEAEKVIIYLSLLSSLDNQSQEVQREMIKTEKMFSDYSEKFLFLHEEYKKMGFNKFSHLANVDMMFPFKNFLSNTSHEIKYLLSEQEERAIIKLSTAHNSNMYEELVSSFEFNFRGDKISEDEIRTLRRSQDRQVRKEAYQALYDMYMTKQNQIVLSNLYSIVCKDNVSDVEMRNYNTVMSQRNMSEELSDSTVDLLLENVFKNYELYHLFLGKKRTILGLDTMENYDVHAPFPSDVEEVDLSFEEGWNLYKNAIEKVDPLLYSFSEEMVNNGRVSVYPNQGKTSGAYAQYTKFLPEFILLNWSDSVGDVVTFAHELGHAFHGSLSKIQKSSVYQTPLTLAETASIFNETLMFETVLEKTSNQQERAKLIYDRLNDIFLTIFRQVAYVRFERRCHESFQRNEPLTSDDYNSIWFEEMKNLHGSGVNVNKNIIQHEWSAIPHIFNTPFYCYTYAFGNIISLNLYENYKNTENKEDFIKKYHEFLSSGGSDTPENLLNKIFGIKLDDNFYNLAFSNIRELINKL